VVVVEEEETIDPLLVLCRPDFEHSPLHHLKLLVDWDPKDFCTHRQVLEVAEVSLSNWRSF